MAAQQEEKKIKEKQIIRITATVVQYSTHYLLPQLRSRPMLLSQNGALFMWFWVWVLCETAEKFYFWIGCNFSTLNSDRRRLNRSIIIITNSTVNSSWLNDRNEKHSPVQWHDSKSLSRKKYLRLRSRCALLQPGGNSSMLLATTIYCASDKLMAAINYTAFKVCVK